MRIIHTYHNFLLLLAVAVLPACNQDLDFDIQEPDAKIVVEGLIEVNQQARVFLTANAPYFSSIDSASLRDLVLSTLLWKA